MRTRQPITPAKLAETYSRIVIGNKACQAVADALAGDDRYEVIYELMDAAVDMGHRNDDDDYDVLLALASEAANLVRPLIMADSHIVTVVK